MSVDFALFDDFDAIARDAGEGLGRHAQSSLFHRLDWFRMVRDDMPRDNLLVVRARNGVGRCWLFLVADGRKAFSLNNGYSLRYGSVTDAAAGVPAPIAGLVGGLRRAGISHLYLEGLMGDDPLIKALKYKGWAVRRTPLNASWQIDTAGMSFDDYWARRPSRLRNTAARRAKRTKLEFRILDRFDAQAMDDYESVYDASWKPPEGAPSLIRRLAMQEGEAGTLRLGLAYHEGRAVAAQLWLVENGVAMIHKLAYRDDARELSPGTLLSVEMFRRALDVDKVATIDFGIGDQEYKAEWMSHRIPVYRLTAYDLMRPAGAVGMARSLASKLVDRLSNRDG